MVLAKLYRDLVRQEGREEGRVAEAHQAREAWNERRLAAENEGRTFTEPPPSRNGTRGEKLRVAEHAEG